jgi:hypothetical protein
VAAFGLIGLGSGAAWAYFSSSGSGTGTATVGTMTTVLLISATVSPSSSLYPGTSGDVVLKVTNPNGFTVTLVKVVQSGTITATGAKGTCSATGGVSFTNQTGLSVTVPAHSSKSIHLATAAAMSTSSPTGCQGATFLIPVTITVEKR